GVGGAGGQHGERGKVEGAANPDVKAMTAIASLLAGGEWMGDINALRADGLGAEILGLTPAAASTVGTFLRAFTVGHVRQLDAVQEDLHDRASRLTQMWRSMSSHSSVAKKASAIALS